MDVEPTNRSDFYLSKEDFTRVYSLVINKGLKLIKIKESNRLDTYIAKNDFFNFYGIPTNPCIAHSMSDDLNRLDSRYSDSLSNEGSLSSWLQS